MYPVSCARNFDYASILDRGRAWVGFRVGHAALGPPKQQNWARDLAKDRAKIIDAMSVGRKIADVIVEFPNQGAVRIPVGTVHGEVAGDLITEMGIGLLHAVDRCFK